MGAPNPLGQLPLNFWQTARVMPLDDRLLHQVGGRTHRMDRSSALDSMELETRPERTKPSPTDQLDAIAQIFSIDLRNEL